MTDQLRNPWAPPGTNPASTTDQPSGASNAPAVPFVAVPETTQQLSTPAESLVADPMPAPIPDATPPVPAQGQPNPLRGWLIAILACLVLSLATQAVTLALLVPHLVTSANPTIPTRTVTLIAIPTAVDANVTVTSQQLTSTQLVADGQRFAVPVAVKSGETVGVLVAASQLVGDARITCMVTDEKNVQLVNSSSIVGVNPSIGCSWTNTGK